jgi:hypothetical protein
MFVALNLLLPLAVLAFAATGLGHGFVLSLQIWLAFVLSYAAGNVGASLLAARKAGWSTLPYLPGAFAAFHFSYGFGFLAGLLRFGLRPVGALPVNSVFARITR